MWILLGGTRICVLVINLHRVTSSRVDPHHDELVHVRKEEPGLGFSILKVDLGQGLGFKV